MTRSLRRFGALVVLAALAIVSCGGDDAPRTYAGMIREPAPDVSAVTLPAADDATTSVPFRAEPGGVLVVYFGYLTCPDVCPTTMADLKTALEQLRPAERARVEVVMGTIDPARDSADALIGYLDAFVDGGRAVRTDDQEALRAATGALGADFRVTTSADGVVEVSHTAFMYLIDDQGRIRVTWPFGLQSADMRDDLRLLLATVASSV